MMADLSTFASVIAVIQLTGSIVEICGGYISKVQNAKQDILHLQQEVGALSGVLMMLSELLKESDEDGTTLKTSQSLFSHVSECSSSLAKLKGKIEPGINQDPVRIWGFRALKWPLQQSEYKKIINDIERYKTLFSLALQVDQTRTTIHLDQKFDLHELRIADGAEFDSYDIQHAECLPGTRTDLLREVNEWATSSNGKCIFWLNGMAGTGKSTISRTVARHFKEEKILGASFFFKRGEEDRVIARRLFPTLIRQLVHTIPQLMSSIQTAIRENPGISEKMLGEQFERLLYRPLLGMKPDHTGTIVIVIDALDECEPEDDIKVILQLLPRVQKISSVRLRFLLTSRPEKSIRLGFNRITNDYQELVLHEIPEPVIEHDISLYFHDKFSNLRQEFSYPSEWPGDESMKSLVHRAVPLFISAATLYRFISDTRQNPDKRLNAILADQAIYVTKMDGTYMPVFNQLLIGLDEWESLEMIHDLKEIVGVIILLANPLSIAGLSRLSNVEIDEVKDRLDLLRSVLNVPDSLDAPVRLLHLSFRDFLLDSKKKDKTAFWIDEKEMHRKVTIQCLQVMRHSLRKNICDLPFDGSPRSQIDTSSRNKYIPSELQYSCRYWIEHLMRTKDPSAQKDDAFSFLQEHFLHWAEAMSILGNISMTIGLLDMLRSAIQDDENLEFSEFLHDAKRFILKFGQIADACPLQLYASGLTFAPRKAILRNYFDKLPDYLHTPPIVDELWNSDLLTFEGHSSRVNSVAFSPDGKLLASGSSDDTVKLWNTTTGALQQTLSDHDLYVYSVAFSPDSQLLASASGQTVKLWDAATGTQQCEFSGHSDTVRSVAFSPNKRLLASGSDDKTIKLWDTASGILQRSFEGHSEWVESVVFSPDGQLLASASHDGTVKLWDSATGTLQQTFDSRGWVTSVSFSPDGQVLASAHNGTVKLWDTATWTLQQTFKSHGWVTSVSFSPDGQVLAFSTRKSIPIWDIFIEKMQLRKFASFANGSHSLAFSPDGQLLPFLNHDTVNLWDVSTGTLQRTFNGHSGPVGSVAFSPNRRLLASGSSDETIKLWDTTNTAPQQAHLEGHTAYINSLVISPNGLLLASSSNDNTIKLWDTTTGALHRTIRSNTHVKSFSSDSRLLASASLDDIMFWDSASGILRYTLRGHSKFVECVTFSPLDSKLLASGSRDQTAKIWDTATGTLQQTLIGHTNSVVSVAISLDSQLLASGSYDQTAKIWNTATGALQQTLIGHTYWVASVVFSPDGRLLASGSTDRTIKLWDTATGELQETLSVPRAVETMSFSEDNLHLLTNLGTLNLQSQYGPDFSKRLESYPEISITDEDWIVYHGNKVLWLPHEYRPGRSAIMHGIVALGSPLGRITIMRFHA